MDKFTVTKEKIKNANTFVPLEVKRLTAKEIAKECLKDTASISGETQILPLPPFKIEMPEIKEMLLIQHITLAYFGVAFDDKDAYGSYNEINRRNLLTQIKKFRNDKEVGEKAINILDDFAVFEKMVNTEIYNLKAIHNDPLNRVLRAINTYLTPQNIEKATELAKKVIPTITEKLENADNGNK